MLVVCGQLKARWPCKECTGGCSAHGLAVYFRTVGSSAPSVLLPSHCHLQRLPVQTLATSGAPCCGCAFAKKSRSHGYTCTLRCHLAGALLCPELPRLPTPQMGAMCRLDLGLSLPCLFSPGRGILPNQRWAVQPHKRGLCSASPAHGGIHSQVAWRGEGLRWIRDETVFQGHQFSAHLF